MKYRFLMIIILCLGIVSSLASVDKPIGINLYNSGPFDSQILFVDIMQQSHEWMVQDVDMAEWDLGESLNKPKRATQPLFPF